MEEQVGSVHVHRIDLGRIVLNVRDIGSGPPVIFLHGITSNSAVFEPLMHRLKGHFRCIAVDQRGHGLSDKPAAGYRARDYAEDIVALAASLEAGPVILVGHSLGARNSVEAAALAPEAVQCVVAIDFTPFIEGEVFDALEQRVNGGDRLFTSREDVETYLHERYALLPAEAVKCRAASAYREVEGGFRPLASAEAMAATAKGLRESLEPAYRAVKRPVLLVCGALSKLVSAAALEKTRALRPDFPVIVVPNTDHYVNEEAPDVIAKAILDFVRQADDHPMTPNAG